MIQKTTNYAQFKILKENRKVRQSHLAKLTVSVMHHNMLDANPIIVNEHMEVIDGQHRLEVAKNNRLPIYYIVVPSSDISDVMELNATVRTWNLGDYIESLVTQGNPNMRFMMEFAQDYGFSYSNVLVLLLRQVPHYDKSPGKFLAHLEFSDLQKEMAKKTGDLISVIARYKTKRGLIPRSVFLAAMRFVDEKRDIALAKQIEKSGKVITISSDPNDMYRVLDAIERKF